MNYEEMSDFEINKRVGMHLGHSVSLEHESVEFGSCFLLTGTAFVRIEFNPCNNPNDAMPIIIENDISLLFDRGDCEVSFKYLSPCGVFGMSELLTHAINVDKDKALRTAMICYLIKRDKEDD